MLLRLALGVLLLGMAMPVDAKPLIFAHRGASALRPEETLAAYERAIAGGADFIEPDLVPTKDGVLVARHESNISETTDVAAHPEFAARKVVKVIDGRAQEGWFTEDFTLAELKTLRAKERLGALRPESMGFDGKFEIATFDEIVALAARSKRPVGLIPELKHPTYFAGLGFDTPGKLVAAIRGSAFLRTAPVIVQCFEIATLKRLHKELAGRRNVALLQLIQSSDVKQPADVVAAGGSLTFDDMVTPRGLAEIATYAQWISPPLRRVIPLDAAGNAGAPARLIADAHRAGLKVSVFTFRPENQFLPKDLQHGDANARWDAGMVDDVRAFVAAGVDGFFTDDPALGRAAVERP
ncbi:glycerophosphoryl diester phosphodiesterase [Novosphingobium sediminis]|uniref:glycerophosphodiester phosphodiesterase n=1 Tax=Novosphingobium sediminis TaxID=707214 RepID=A0A512AL55_9SPHN|nr:glycerophosphodiester phosphodiesterase family protein [Novosphingobium sediminis]GEO00445.1 glycerophosphoryl diester phosphodiesterase [Novosphingobium sediminis]